MPAKPRPFLELRRDPEERRARAIEAFRDGVREPADRDFGERDLLEVDRLDDFLARDRRDLVSPFSRRILLTVRAATSWARPPYRPDFLALCLMCLYCRSRFGLAPLGIESPFPSGYAHPFVEA